MALTLLPTLSRASTEPLREPLQEKVLLQHAPAPKTRFFKRLELRHALIVKESKTLGREIDATNLDQLEVETRLLIHHFDDYVDPAKGVFRRRYDDIRLDAQAALPTPTGPQSDSLFADSPLNGKSVVFTKMENGEYGRYYDVEEGPEELLPRLAIDTSMACLLPDHPVAPGDEWEIEPAALRDMLGYAGDLELIFTRDMNDILLARNMLFGVGGSLWYAFASPPTGVVKAKLEEISDRQGRPMGIIALNVDITCDVDQTELANKNRNAIEITGGFRCESATLQVKLNGNGKLFWDLDNNLPFKMNIVMAEEVVTSHKWGERETDTPMMFPAAPSQRVELIGVVRLDLSTTIQSE